MPRALFLPAAVVDRLLDALEASEGRCRCFPVVDTLARHDVTGRCPAARGPRPGPDPAGLPLRDIVRAHAAWQGAEATDDAQVARAAGLGVATVAGDPRLEKLTYEEDFARAEVLLARVLASRTGFGFDVHAFGPGDSASGGIR